jgi:sugar phosphate isomerase/epimerase
MKLGFLTTYSEGIVEFAQQTGYKCLELAAWPGGELDAEKVTDERLEEICKVLDRHNIKVSGLGYYPNFLDPDLEKQSKCQNYFIKLLDVAVKMKVGVLCTFAGRSPDKSIPENIPLFKKVFTKFCEEAEKRNLRIAIENCPIRTVPNMAISPEVWDQLFKAIPSRSLGLLLDSSHCVYTGIDYVKAIYDYGERIYHVHAKDTEIRRDVLGRVGIYGTVITKDDDMGEHGWWRARIPGWGEINWPKLITALIEVKYTGDVIIEHEDQVFAKAAGVGPIEKEDDISVKYGNERTGLTLGYNTLSRLMPQ